MVSEEYATPQNRHEEFWWQGSLHMDIPDGEVLWYTQGAKSIKGNYFIFIFRASTICVVPMPLWTQEHHYILVCFIEEMIAYHDDVKINSLFTQLINIRKKGPVIEHI